MLQEQKLLHLQYFIKVAPRPDLASIQLAGRLMSLAAARHSNYQHL